MCSEGRQIRRNGLVVTDVRIDLLEDPKNGPFSDRRNDAGLREAVYQSDCFDKDRFATRVGTAHHDRMFVVVEREIEGDGCSRHRGRPRQFLRIGCNSKERMYSRCDSEFCHPSLGRRHSGNDRAVCVGIARTRTCVINSYTHLEPLNHRCVM